jgi:hypothetical protein
MTLSPGDLGGPVEHGRHARPQDCHADPHLGGM